MIDVMARSPFPGMDPYMEASWSDVHTKLLAYLGEALQPTLPPALRARNEEAVWIQEEGDEDGNDEDEYDGNEYDDEDEPLRRLAKPDVVIVEDRPELVGESDGAGVAVADPPIGRVEPVTLKFHYEPEVHRWLQIIDADDGNRVVTVVEVLSPANKYAGAPNRLYRRKLEDYAHGRVNVVEIDLLRGSRWHLEVRGEHVPARRRAPYYACVRRARSPATWKVYPMPLRTALPPIPIPLRRKDAEVWLEPQPLIDRAYVAGAYDRTNYAKPAVPPLKGDDAEWADELLKAAGKR